MINELFSLRFHPIILKIQKWIYYINVFDSYHRISELISLKFNSKILFI